MASLKEMFDAADGDYLEFCQVENPLSQRADLCAFLILDRLVPGGGDIVSASEHDEFFLSIDCSELEKVATPEIVRDLRRCGVMYSEEYNCLSMFA